jgi:hypothetical protein
LAVTSNNIEKWISTKKGMQKRGRTILFATLRKLSKKIKFENEKITISNKK